MYQRQEVENGNPDGEQKLLKVLLDLKTQVEEHTPASEILRQPTIFPNRLEGLLTKMKDTEFFIHKILKKFIVNKMGGKYNRGPLKDPERILAKAANDYGWCLGPAPY